MLSWPQRRKYDCPTYYKYCAVSRAAGVLAVRKKSLRRGLPSRAPYSLKPQLISYQGFKIEDGKLRIPIARRKFQYIPLAKHTLAVLSNTALTVRSFTLTPSSLSLTILKEVPGVECTEAIGVDVNLLNLTVGNEDKVTQYDVHNAVRIVETTAEVVGSFKRNDSRIQEKIASKYGRRRQNRNEMCFTMPRSV